MIAVTLLIRTQGLGPKGGKPVMRGCIGEVLGCKKKYKLNLVGWLKVGGENRRYNSTYMSKYDRGRISFRRVLWVR